MEQEFEIDYKLLPPKLQIQLWVLALDTDTSKVNLAYKTGCFRTNLTYNYGGNAEASLGINRNSATISLNPEKKDISLGMVIRGFKFGTSANIVKKSTSFNLSYGASLLPFPDELSNTFNSAAVGLQSITKNIQSAPNNPLAWYNLHSNDMDTISKAVKAGQQLAKQNNNANNFGAGLQLKYNPETGLTIFGGAQYTF